MGPWTGRAPPLPPGWPPWLPLLPRQALARWRIHGAPATRAPSTGAGRRVAQRSAAGPTAPRCRPCRSSQSPPRATGVAAARRRRRRRSGRAHAWARPRPRRRRAGGRACSQELKAWTRLEWGAPRTGRAPSGASAASAASAARRNPSHGRARLGPSGQSGHLCVHHPPAGASAVAGRTSVPGSAARVAFAPAGASAAAGRTSVPGSAARVVFAPAGAMAPPPAASRRSPSLSGPQRCPRARRVDPWGARATG